MQHCIKILKIEQEKVYKILSDEIWLEGERRNCYVSETDETVRKHVDEILLNILDDLEKESFYEVCLKCNDLDCDYKKRKNLC